MAAWGDVTERSFSRMVAKPDWGIRSIVGPDGQDHLVDVKTVVERPFGNLIQFFVRRRAPMARKVMLVAPMSGITRRCCGRPWRAFCPTPMSL